MKKQMLVLVLAVFLTPVIVSAQNALIQRSEEISPDDLTDLVRHRLGLFPEDSQYEKIVRVKISNPVDMLIQPELVASFPGVGQVKMHTRGITRIDENSLVWQGTVGEDKAIQTLNVRGGGIHGQLQVGSTLWFIEPTHRGAARHLWAI